MGLATVDPHSQKEHTEIHKIPKFGVNHVKIYKEMYGHLGVCPDGHTFHVMCYITC